MDRAPTSDEVRLNAAHEGGVFKTLLTYARLSGPGWLQSAITLGGGSLAGALFLGVLTGTRLLWVQLPLRLRIEKGSVSGFTSLVLSPRALTLEDSDLNINLEVFERALRRFRVHLGGMPVHLAAETLELRRAGPGAARGTMRWDQAAVRSPVALSLGTLNLDLSDAEGGWVGALSNDSQEIRIGGSIRVGEGWAWSSEIRLAPGPRADERLRQALPLLGQPDRSGTVVLKASGRLASTPQG